MREKLIEELLHHLLFAINNMAADNLNEAIVLKASL